MLFIIGIIFVCGVAITFPLSLFTLYLVWEKDD